MTQVTWDNIAIHADEVKCKLSVSQAAQSRSELLINEFSARRCISNATEMPHMH